MTNSPVNVSLQGFFLSLCIWQPNTEPTTLHVHHTTPAAKPTTPYHSHPHITNMEVTAKCFHVPATLSDGA